MGAILMSKFKKRETERKGSKKRRILENKLIVEHLEDLTKAKAEELPEEEVLEEKK